MKFVGVPPDPGAMHSAIVNLKKMGNFGELAPLSTAPLLVSARSTSMHAWGHAANLGGKGNQWET